MGFERKLRRPNRTALAALHNHEPVFGIAQTVADVGVTEAALASGFDFIMLDCQRGDADFEAHAQSIERIKSHPASLSAVRVKAGDWRSARAYSALGVNVILAPDVDDVASAMSFVENVGVGPRAPLKFAMIESGRGVACVDEIADVVGIDGLVIGPTDLSTDLGVSDGYKGEAYREAFARVEAAARRANRILGSKPHTERSLGDLIEAGHSFLMVGSDCEAMRQGFVALRTEVGSAAMARR